jgi:hypothetical protein
VKEGGTDHISNLQPEHRYCNRKAGAQLGAALKRQQAEVAAQARIAATYRMLEGSSA